jgi:hypothetical protein
MAEMAPDPPKSRRSGSANLGRSVGVTALVIALVVGVQLGRIPFRYRRQIWLLQGFLLGGLVGYVVGRLSGAEPAAAGERSGRHPLPPGT